MSLLDSAIAERGATQPIQEMPVVEKPPVQQGSLLSQAIEETEPQAVESEGFDFLAPAKSFAALPETAFQLAGAGATWLTGELGAAGYTVANRLRNTMLPKETGYMDDSRLAPVDPKDIAAGANFIRESVPKIVPAPIMQKTAENMDMVGKTLETLMFWHKPIIKGFESLGMPDVGPMVNFVFDLAAFKGMHKLGNKSYSALRRLNKKMPENPTKALADFEKELEGMGLKKEDLSTPEARQAWLNKQPGFEDYGPSNQKFQTAEWSRRDADRTKPQGRPEEVVAEQPVEPNVVSGAKPVEQTNVEAQQQQGVVQELRNQIQPQDIANRDIPPEARRITEAARQTPKPEVQEIPPEVSGLDQPVLMTADGKLYYKDGREVQVEQPKPAEPIAEPTPAPDPVVDNSYKNLMEVSEVKAEKSGPTRIDLERLDDWVENELETLYKDGGKTRMHTVAKQLLETGELDSPGLVKTFKKWYESQGSRGEAKPVAEDGLQRVDPEIGRAPGEGIESPTKRADLGTSDLVAEVALENQPIRRPDGQLAKTKTAAERYARKQGRIGEAVPNPSGEGWLVKPTKAQRKQIKKRDLEQWDKILEEEGLTVDEGRDAQGGIRDLFDLIDNERGELRISTDDFKKIKGMFESGRYDNDALKQSLIAKGASADQVSKFTEGLIAQAQATGQSKWLQKGQDPNEILPRETKANGKLTPAVTRSAANAVAQAKDMDARTLGESWSLETSNRGMERAGEAIQNEFHTPLRRKTSDFNKERKQVFKVVDKIEKTFSQKEKERLYSYATQLQEGGVEILKLQGKEVVTQLTPKELAAYDKMRADFKVVYDRLNAAREAAGESTFPAVDNYFTLANDIAWLRDSYGIGLYDNYKTVNGYLFGEHKTTPSSFHTKARAADREMLGVNLYLDKAGHTHKLNSEQIKNVREHAQQVLDGEQPIALTPEEMAVYRKAKQVVVKTLDNPFTAYKRYMNESLDYIHRGPELARQKELLSDKYGLHAVAPNTHLFLSQWRDAQTGMRLPWDASNLKTRKRIQRANKSVVMGYLAGAPQSAIKQLGSFAHTFGITGHHAVTGVLDAMSPAKWKMAWDKSATLNTRSPEVSLDIARGYEAQNKVMKALDKVSEVEMTPLDVMDKFTATASWLAFYRQAQGMKKFTTDAQRVNYADNWTSKTQGSASMLDRAPIQRSLLGGTLTGLQTFAINEFNFIAKDILGIKNPDVNSKTKAARTARFIAGVTLFNALSEEIIGMNAASPTPIKTARKKADELSKDGKLDTKEKVRVGAAGLSELANYIPIIGSALKYGTQLGGPTISLLYDMAKDLNKTGTVNPKDVATLLGRGDVRQALKMHEAYERNGTVVDVMLGNYVPKPKEDGISFPK